MNDQILNAPNQTTLVNFGRYLENCRRQRNISLAVLAKFLSLDVTQLSAVECGMNTIDPRKFPLLSGLLDVDVREIQNRYYAQCA